METSTEQAIKLAIVGFTGLSKDALHIHVGLAAFFLASFLLRKSIRSPLPLLIVLALAVLGEITDARDDIASLGHWRWSASLHDVLNTMFWPLLICGLGRRSAAFSPQK